MTLRTKFSHRDTKIILFKTFPTISKNNYHTEAQRQKKIICRNTKKKLRRGLVSSVSSVTLCENRGFTLIELIVALLIFSIISTILFSTLIQIQRKTNVDRWKNELTEEGTRICNTIRWELTGAREIYYADRDSISFINQEGNFSTIYWKNSLLFSSNKKIVSKDTKVTSFKFVYYLPREIPTESSVPEYYLPLDLIDLEKLQVIDWEMELQKGITYIHLKTGIFIRNTR
jgi:prepilin-type N-terminal cleavage/methylation domain-containing protein